MRRLLDVNFNSRIHVVEALMHEWTAGQPALRPVPPCQENPSHSDEPSCVPDSRLGGVEAGPLLHTEIVDDSLPRACEEQELGQSSPVQSSPVHRIPWTKQKRCCFLLKTPNSWCGQLLLLAGAVGMHQCLSGNACSSNPSAKCVLGEIPLGALQSHGRSSVQVYQPVA